MELKDYFVADILKSIHMRGLQKVHENACYEKPVF